MESSSIQKLRNLYTQTQNNIYRNQPKVNQQRLNKLIIYTNTELQKCQKKGEYQHLDQMVFYKEKFADVQNVLSSNKSDEDKQKSIKKIVDLNFNKQKFNSDAVMKPTSKLPRVEEVEIEDNRKSHLSNKSSEDERNTKEALFNFLDTKKREVERSHVGFKSILEKLPYQENKFKVKGSRINNNNGEVQRLHTQITMLKSKLNEKKDSNSNVDREYYETEIRTLQNSLYSLERENDKLKSEKDSQPSNDYYYTVSQPDKNEKYEPYTITYKENNIDKIMKKNQNQSNANNSIRDFPPEGKNFQKVKTNFVENNYFQKDLSLIKDRKYSANYVKSFLDDEDKSQKFSMLNSNAGDMYDAADQSQTAIIRSKVAFFRKEMVLHRGQTFDVAFKRSSLANYSKLQMLVFVNNKTNQSKNVKIEYDVDPKYYNFNVVRRLSTVQGKSQGRQELSIQLINKQDIDSIISATVTFDNNKNIKVLLPAMFIDLYENMNVREENYQKIKIVPLKQFSAFHLAQEVLPVVQEFDPKLQVGKCYGASKYNEGYIKLTWKDSRNLQLQTVKQWKLFFGFLLMDENK